MREQRWGRVLAITSVGVRQPIAGADPLERRALRAHRRSSRRWPARWPATASPSTRSSPALHDTDRIRELYGGDVDASQRGHPRGRDRPSRGLRADRRVPVLGVGVVRHRRRDSRRRRGVHGPALTVRSAYNSLMGDGCESVADRHDPQPDLAACASPARRCSSGCSSTTSCIAAAALLAVLGASDWVDGWIARRFDQGSDLGKVLDPVADRILLLVAAVALLVAGQRAARRGRARARPGGCSSAWRCSRSPRPAPGASTCSGSGKAGTLALMFAFPLFLLGRRHPRRRPRRRARRRLVHRRSAGSCSATTPRSPTSRSRATRCARARRARRDRRERRREGRHPRRR